MKIGIKVDQHGLQQLIEQLDDAVQQYQGNTEYHNIYATQAALAANALTSYLNQQLDKTLAVTKVWQVRPTLDWGHAGSFGIQLDMDSTVSDDNGDTHTEVKLRFDDGTWSWYPIDHLVAVA